jgi:hypothetical protein
MRCTCENARREARAEAFEYAARAVTRRIDDHEETLQSLVAHLEALAAHARAPHGDKPPAMLHDAFEPERASSTAPSAPTVMLLNPATGKFVTPDTLHTYQNGEHRTYRDDYPDFPVEDQPR